MLNLSAIIWGFVIILTPVFIIILDNRWELPVSLFIMFHNALFLFLADKMSLSTSLFCLFYHFPKNQSIILNSEVC